jgi:hypothetical protein
MDFFGMYSTDANALPHSRYARDTPLRGAPSMARFAAWTLRILALAATCAAATWCVLHVYDAWKYGVDPTPDPTSASGILIPSGVPEAMLELDRMLSQPFRRELREQHDMPAEQHDFGLGLWIRNNWGLWSGSRLAVYFAEAGVRHPDTMSGIVLRAYARHLRGEPPTFQEELDWYQRPR